MKFQDWSKDFEVGIASIDKDHQTLFNSIKQLGEHISAQNGSEPIKATLNSLLLYVDEHFEKEERFLIGAGYPDFIAHKKEHDAFRDSIFSLRDYYTHNHDAVDAQKVVTFLESWLLNHILKVDKAYTPYLMGDKKGDPQLQEKLAKQLPGKTIQLSCPADKKEHVEHFINLIREGGEEGVLIEAAVEKITALQNTRREKQAKKLFGF